MSPIQRTEESKAMEGNGEIGGLVRLILILGIGVLIGEALQFLAIEVLTTIRRRRRRKHWKKCTESMEEQ